MAHPTTKFGANKLPSAITCNMFRSIYSGFPTVAVPWKFGWFFSFLFFLLKKGFCTFAAATTNKRGWSGRGLRKSTNEKLPVSLTWDLLVSQIFWSFWSPLAIWGSSLVRFRVATLTLTMVSFNQHEMIIHCARHCLICSALLHPTDLLYEIRFLKKRKQTKHISVMKLFCRQESLYTKQTNRQKHTVWL